VIPKTCTIANFSFRVGGPYGTLLYGNFVVFGAHIHIVVLVEVMGSMRRRNL